VTINDEEAFRRNIVENRERKETTPIDDAYNQRRLRDDFGWTDTKIAEFYGLTASYVGLLKKLLSLPTQTQKLVHVRQLSVKAAVALTELTPEEQQKAMEPIPDPTSAQIGSTPAESDSQPLPFDSSPMQSDEKPTQANSGEKLSSRVVKAVRAAKIEKGGKQARSLAEVRKFFEELTGPAENRQVKALAEMMLKFIQGRLTDKTMATKLNILFSAQETSHSDKMPNTAA
jgi:ParB-like chromosome segregation protein Spo0J